MSSRNPADVTVLRWSRYHLQKLLRTGLLSRGGSWPRPPSSSLSIRCSVLPATLAQYILSHKCLLRFPCSKSYTGTDAVRGSLTAWWVLCVPGQGSRDLCGHSAGSQRGWEAGHRARNDNPVSTYKAQTSGPVSHKGTQ